MEDGKVNYVLTWEPFSILGRGTSFLLPTSWFWFWDNGKDEEREGGKKMSLG